MFGLRLGVIWAILAGFAGVAQTALIPAPQAEVVDRLSAAFATHDPARLAVAYRAMGDYGKPAASIVESSINAMGYRHLKNGEIDKAIAVLQLNADTFPYSANAWDSLGEAVMCNDEREKAMRYFRRSLELDPDNRNAARMIDRLSGKVRLSQAESGQDLQR